MLRRHQRHLPLISLDTEFLYLGKLALWASTGKPLGRHVLALRLCRGCGRQRRSSGHYRVHHRSCANVLGERNTHSDSRARPHGYGHTNDQPKPHRIAQPHGKPEPDRVAQPDTESDPHAQPDGKPEPRDRDAREGRRHPRGAHARDPGE